MTPVPSERSSRKKSAKSQLPASPMIPRAIPARKARGRWRRWGAVASGIVVVGLAAAFARSELYPAELAEADAAYRRNDLGTALRLAEGYLARRPANRRAALIAARCLSRTGQLDQAETDYQKAAPLSVDDQHIRAFAFVLNNRRDQAIRAYREILEHDPEDVLAMSRLAAVLISESRWSDVLEISERLIKIPAGAVIGHALGGVVHHNTGDSELAVFAFSRVLALDPELKQMPLKPRSMFWTEYGHNLLMVSCWAEARRCLNHALEEGNDAKVADLLGQSYFLEGDFDEAERWWRLALSWDPDRYGTWWRIGKLELLRGRAAEALEPLHRSTSLAPKAGGPLYSLVLAYRLLGRNAEAQRSMEQIQHLRAENVASSRAAADQSLIDTEDKPR